MQKNTQNNKTIVVTGATGQQGGAVVHSLIAHGWRVRALVRNLESPAAGQLAESNVELVRGDLFTPSSLDRALDGAYGVFGVQTFAEKGTAGEIIQGRLLADAAHRAGIQHFVYSSVGAAERDPGVPSFASKWQIEKHIHALNLPATIIRPVFFMENFEKFFGEPIKQQQKLILPVHPDTRLQMIAVEDIGAFAALAFEQPASFIGKALEIAGDELSITEVAETFSRVMQRPIQFVELPISEISEGNPEFAVMFQWFNEQGFQAVIPALRGLYPPLLNLETWLHKSSWQG